MDYESDWRLSRGQGDYLRNVTFQLRQIHPQKHFPEFHKHCELCWATISPQIGDEQEGYRSSDGRYWVCKDCFSTFKNYLNWKDEPYIGQGDT